MATATDSDSSTRRSAAPSLGGHIAILNLMLKRLRIERETLPEDAIGDRVMIDTRIKNVERDLQTVRQRLLGFDE
jgi:hypothetical protein